MGKTQTTAFAQRNAEEPRWLRPIGSKKNILCFAALRARRSSGASQGCYEVYDGVP